MEVEAAATELIKSFSEDPKKTGIDDFMRELLEFLKRFDRAQHENTARELKVMSHHGGEGRISLCVGMHVYGREGGGDHLVVREARATVGSISERFFCSKGLGLLARGSTPLYLRS